MSDFCYSRPMLDRIFRQAEFMDRMMQHVGVDPAAAVRLDRGMAWYEARTRCIACCKERKCLDWLGRTQASSQPPEFCHNAEFFSRCRQENPSVNADLPSSAASMEERHDEGFSPSDLRQAAR